MAFIDGFVAAVPTANLEEYRSHAAQAAKLFKRHGAIRSVEAWGEDVPHGKLTDFYMSVKAKEDETVVFAWIEWPDKETRDAGMEKAMADMPAEMAQMPFDGQRMIYGGFRSIVDE